MKSALDEAAVVAALNQLDLRPNCDLMIHGSLSALGFVDGGAETLVRAFRSISGPGGAVIAPSFRQAIRSDKYTLTQCADCPTYDVCPSREEGTTGVIGETVRAQPDSLRSCNPSHTWVGVGDDAAFLLEGHRHSLTPCGKDSPFFRLMEHDGKVLLIGVGVNSITNIHAVEDALNVPYLSAVDTERRHATYTTSGRRIQYVYPELLQAAFREAGILRTGRVGAGWAHVLSARDLGSFLMVAAEDDPWCLALRPRGNAYEPFEDACRKVARMVRAWRLSTSRDDGWKRLLGLWGVERALMEFEVAENPATGCPAYRGKVRGYHRCAANDIPPWEKFEDYPPFEPGVATCGQCNYPDSRP